MAKCRGHTTINIDGVVFHSDFDSGNLRQVAKSSPSNPYEFQVWTAPDNSGTQYESNHSSWFHFSVTGLPKMATIKFHMMNTKKHGGLYRSDMRPVYRSNVTQGKWHRIKKSVRTDEDGRHCFEHTVELDNDVVYFAFTYPYSYATLQTELARLDQHQNALDAPGTIYYTRELLACSIDQRRVDLITITSVDGHSADREELIPDIFPTYGIGQAALEHADISEHNRPHVFPQKEVIVISARVHPGEVPAQHTMKGIMDLLLDPHDPRSVALRSRYVFKIVPMLNPDGVFRGHFRMDQLGQNLNRYYADPDKLKQPSIFALRKLIDFYAEKNSLSMYLDLHAHASKRGCFIYGNVVDSFEDQVQNQLFCRLIALNTPHFDYEACLFSKEHMARTDPGDGMTAEGSSRVFTYLAHKVIHSYTLECNYNTGRVGNEVPAPEGDLGASSTPMTYRSCDFTSTPEKYTPMSYENVGQACLVAMLDLRGQNPCSRISKSKFRTLDRIRLLTVSDVRQLVEFRGCTVPESLRRDNLTANNVLIPGKKSNSSRSGSSADSNSTAAARARTAELMWKRCCVSPPAVAPVIVPVGVSGQPPSIRSRSLSSGSTPRESASAASSISSGQKQPKPPIKNKPSTHPMQLTVPTKGDALNIGDKLKDNSNNYVKTRPSRPPLSAKDLRVQLQLKLEESSPDYGNSPSIDEELTKIVTASAVSERAALANAMSAGKMHPPPRVLSLLLKGPPIKQHSFIPSTHSARHRQTNLVIRSNSARDNKPTVLNGKCGDANNVIDDHELDAQTEVYEDDNVTPRGLSEEEENSIQALGHQVYPLRASRKNDITTMRSVNSSNENSANEAIVKSFSADASDKLQMEHDPGISTLITVKKQYKSMSPSKVAQPHTVVYDEAAERERATLQIAKLIGKDTRENSSSHTPQTRSS